MFYKVRKVQTLPNYIISITFENDIVKKYDVKPLFNKWTIFQTLVTTAGLFEQVKVDKGGYGVSWNEELDLSCNELWENSII